MNTLYTIMIFEIMGRPSPYIKEALSQLVDKIREEKGCVIIEKRVFEPKLVEGQQDLFTTFAEVELSFEKLEYLLHVVFTYMPSHIDIVRPQDATMSNAEMNFLVNQLAGKLHQYDEVAKRMMIENDQIKRYLESVKASPQKEKYPQIGLESVDAGHQDKKEEKLSETPKKKKYQKKKEIGSEKEEVQRTENYPIPEVAVETPKQDEVILEKETENHSSKLEDPELLNPPEMSVEDEEYLDHLDEVLEDEKLEDEEK